MIDFIYGGNELQINEELRKKNLDLFEAIYKQRPEIDPDENKKYRMERAASGEPILYIKNALPTGDIRMNSLYDPVYEAERWADKQGVLRRKTTFCLLGFSTGVFLRALKNAVRPDTVVVMYEPEEGLFSFVCGFVDITDLLVDYGHLVFLVTDRQRSLVQDSIIDVATADRPDLKKLITPFYSDNKEFSDACYTVSILIEGNKNYQFERARDALKCRVYSWNHLRSNYILPDLRKRLPNGIPAVIVSAGPSLSKNVEVLKKIKGHALIVCVDRAVSVLEEHGIIPDIVGSLDAQKDPGYMEAEVTKNAYLMCSMQVNYKAQKMFDGRCIYYHALKYENELMGEKVEADINGVDQGGNVAGGSFFACQRLGIKTIILIGQDMAYIDGRHHADSKTEGAPTGLRVQAEDIYGNMIETREMWLSFRDFFERQIKQFPDIRVIDATEGGLLIHGSEIMTLEEVAEKVCTKEYDLDEIFRGLPKAQNQEEYEAMMKKLHQWIDDFDMISEHSKEITTICEQLLKVSKYQDITDPKYMKKIKRLDALRLDLYKTYSNALMEDYWIEDMFSIPEITFMLRNNEEAQIVFQTAVNYYSKLPENCAGIKQILLDAIDGKY